MTTHDVLDALNDYSCSGYPVLKKHVELAESCCGVEGDIVECGVLNGGSAGAIAYGLPGRPVWLYDSFHGFPEPTESDPPDTWDFVGEPRLNGSLERVVEALSIGGCKILGEDAGGYIIRAGWFEDTFRLTLPEKVAYLHLDCDWYASVLLSLDTFYDRVSPGGVVVIDDWSWWEGARRAFYDWAQRTDEFPLLETFGYGQAYWRKGETRRRTHP